MSLVVRVDRKFFPAVGALVQPSSSVLAFVLNQRTAVGVCLRALLSRFRVYPVALVDALALVSCRSLVRRSVRCSGETLVATRHFTFVGFVTQMCFRVSSQSHFGGKLFCTLFVGVGIHEGAFVLRLPRRTRTRAFLGSGRGFLFQDRFLFRGRSLLCGAGISVALSLSLLMRIVTFRRSSSNKQQTSDK